MPEQAKKSVGRPIGPVKERITTRVTPATKALIKAMGRKFDLTEGEAIDFALNFSYAVCYNAFMEFSRIAKAEGLNRAINEPSIAAVKAMKGINKANDQV